MKLAFASAAGVAALCGSASAQVTLNGAFAVDNGFTAYISTSPTLQGTAWLSGNNWQSTITGNTVINAAGTYYLHVIAFDQGGPRMFLGEFSLQNAGGFTGTFSANGGTSLLTNTTDWVVSDTGLGQNTFAPVDQGGNTVNAAIWGQRPNIDASSRFIWGNLDITTTYFSTTIRVIPAPSALGMIALGGLVASRRRR
ncbi:MAG: hypothetical protein IBJ18_03635 [Phycisphaerales bacterium]|nr:hypothetical protein [Phycisphaerales bacterium]